MVRKDPEKNREYQKAWYQKNKELHIARNQVNKQKKLDWYHEYKSSQKCVSCGQDHPATLDFHHRDPNDKIDQICELVRGNYSMDRILAEVAKCDVLCANCHRILHYNLIN